MVCSLKERRYETSASADSETGKRAPALYNAWLYLVALIDIERELTDISMIDFCLEKGWHKLGCRSNLSPQNQYPLRRRHRFH